MGNLHFLKLVHMIHELANQAMSRSSRDADHSSYSSSVTLPSSASLSSPKSTTCAVEGLGLLEAGSPFTVFPPGGLCSIDSMSSPESDATDSARCAVDLLGGELTMSSSSCSTRREFCMRRILRTRTGSGWRSLGERTCFTVSHRLGESPNVTGRIHSPAHILAPGIGLACARLARSSCQGLPPFRKCAGTSCWSMGP